VNVENSGRLVEVLSQKWQPF